MSVSITSKQIAMTASQPFLVRDNSSAVQPLTAEHGTEVLTLLPLRAVHTVLLAGFILDNGLESPLNRGSFYAYRDSRGTSKASL